MWSWQHGTNKWLWNTKGHPAARGSGSRLLTAGTAIRSLGRPCEICSGYSDTGNRLPLNYSVSSTPPPPPAVISPMIQVNSSFNKMINGTNKFLQFQEVQTSARTRENTATYYTLRMCQGCALWSHVRTVVQGMCSAAGSTDPSVVTDNCLEREEYSDYKQILPTFMILLRTDDVLCQKAHTLNAGNYHYSVVCCHMLWQIITQSTWCCSLFLKSSHKQRF